MPKNMTILSLSGTKNDVAMQIEVNSKEAAAKVIQQFRQFDSVGNVSMNGIQSEVNDEAKTETIVFTLTVTYAPKQTATVTE